MTARCWPQGGAQRRPGRYRCWSERFGSPLAERRSHALGILDFVDDTTA